MSYEIAMKEIIAIFEKKGPKTEETRKLRDQRDFLTSNFPDAKNDMTSYR